jgi:hypothetical protein
MWGLRGAVRRSVVPLLLASVLAAPSSASARPPGPPAPPEPTASGGLLADLDGRPLNLVEVGLHYCHDFAYPRIHCFSRAPDLKAAVAPILAASSLNYVVVFDFTSWQGPYMYFSQDYTVLASIGWNDRISSYLGQSNLSGRFWTDWFYTGSSYTFCCNLSAASLGGFDNSFSSVYKV